MISCKLNDLCSLVKGKQIDTTLLDRTHTYKYINGGIKESGYYNDYNTEGDTIIISEGGASCGFVNYISERFWLGCHCYKLENPSINKKYLYYLLKANQNRIMELRTGAAMPNIKKASLCNLQLRLTLDEKQQKLVTRLLDAVEKSISISSQILVSLDELIKSRFIEMFGDPIENILGWGKYPLGKRCIIITGNTPSRADANNYGSYLEWIKSDNINTPEMYLTHAQEYLSEKGFKKCRYVESGSILMTCIAGSIGCIGNVGIANRRVAFNQQINAIVPVQDETMYIYWLMKLSQPYIQSTISMSLKGILSKSQLSALEFPFPPIAQQRAFSVVAQQVDKSKYGMLNRIKSAMIELVHSQKLVFMACYL